MPPRISPSTYPIAAAATALALDYEAEEEIVFAQQPSAAIADPVLPGQQPLFAQPEVRPAALRRVISFDELTTPEERESIRARVAATASRPSPIKTATVGVRHARASKSRKAQDQRTLEFSGEEHVVSPLRSALKCDALVAPRALRIQAAALDAGLMLLGCLVCFGVYAFAGGSLPSTKQGIGMFLAALATIPAAYRLLWTWAGQDSVGMQHFGLRLVDFDGNPPSASQRFYRLGGSIISLLAAGMGLIWACCDGDELTWHDHMSSTFPTVITED